MTTAEVLEALARECPNGVSFDPMAVRLLRQKIPIEDWQIEKLKEVMFQMGNGLWFTREMIFDNESLLEFERQSMEWIKENGCFSVKRLFEKFCSAFRHITTPEDCAAFLRHLDFEVAVWKKGGHFCYLPPPKLDDILEYISKLVAEWIEETGGTLTFYEIEQELPQLTVEALESIRAQLLPEINVVKIGGVPCWCSTESIPLPEDFCVKLTTLVDTLVLLGEKVTIKNLEFALNLFYRIRFREEYALQDNPTFMRICANHYQGANDVFADKKKPGGRANGWSMPGRRVRSPNTRFGNLGVPVGAKLTFTKGNNVTCTVLDDSNQVEYGGKAWSISALAMFLLDVSSANGFAYFSYEGETLLERRSRLEQEDKQNTCEAYKIPPHDEVQAKKGEIIGLEGRALSQSSWDAFRRDGTNSRVAEWVRRVAKGEKLEQLALESGYAVSTMKNMISNYRLYFKVCKQNGIVPEGGTNV